MEVNIYSVMFVLVICFYSSGEASQYIDSAFLNMSFVQQQEYGRFTMTISASIFRYFDRVMRKSVFRVSDEVRHKWRCTVTEDR